MSTKYEVRPLRKEDLYNGFLKTLDNLRKPDNLESNHDLDFEKASSVFSQIEQNSNHFTYVAVNEHGVFSTITLLIENKFIHEGRNIGHIEDVVTRKGFEGQGASKSILCKLLDIAKENNCYKTILNCKDDKILFYEKIGFEQAHNEMRFDHD